jgi:Coenzyme PQQ synthesis protein D (PqqD)
MILRIATGQVISEVVDDEAIIINSLTGAYYSLDPVGTSVWALLQQGPSSTESLERVVIDGYVVDDSQARLEVQALVRALLDEGLVQECDDPPVEATDAATESQRAYTAPTLSKYTDMEELLLLDPIHEVDAQGWPVARDDA